MDSPRTQPAGTAAAKPLWGFIAALAAVYIVWLVAVPNPQQWRDLVLYTAILLSCTAAVFLRARCEPVDRAPWVILGVGLLIWTAADALYTANVQEPQFCIVLQFGRPKPD